MSEKVRRRMIARRFPHEQTWLHEFIGFHGTDAVTRFCEDDLRGVSLVQVLQALANGTVTSSEKCDGPGAVCGVEHQQDDGVIVTVTVHFVSNEGMLTVRYAEVVKEPSDETNDAA